MRKVRGKLCRNRKGQFTRCRGRASTSGGGRKKGTCKFGRSKTTGKCLKRRRSKRC